MGDTSSDSLLPTVDNTPKEPKKDLRRREFPRFKRGTVMWDKLHRIIAMQVAGVKTTTIAETLNIAPQTVRNYLYHAREQGIIEDDGVTTAKEHLEFSLVPKAIQVIHDALHDDTRHVTSGQKVSQQVALEVTKGTVFKEFDRVIDIAQTNNAIQINVVMPDGPPQQIREGAISGIPAFVDGESL